MKKIVLATGNQGKVRELDTLLSDFGFDVVAQTELGVGSVEETGLTFVENALIKARHAAKVTGLPAIADDSGISVDALNGAPGIYSARYSGIDGDDKANIKKLLTALNGVPQGKRQAQFNCVLVYLRHAEDPTPIICFAQWQGEVIFEEQGEGGFGYDPIFFVPELNCTAAQLSREEKSQISHRGKALKQLLSQLQHV